MKKLITENKHYQKLNKRLSLIILFLFFLFLFFLYILHPKQNPIKLSYCQPNLLKINYHVDNKFKVMQFKILDIQGNFIDGGKLLMHDSTGTIELSLENEYDFYTIKIKNLSDNFVAASSNVHIIDEFNCNELHLETNDMDSITINLNNESVILNLQFIEEQ